ncbi:hypothetical protein V6N13_016688 [Hibiscus sabdariffa]
MEKEKRRKVTCFVEEEILWKLHKSMIGYTASDSDTARIQDRLCSWGLGEIKVKRLTGRVFLLEFEDNELPYPGIVHVWKLVYICFSHVDLCRHSGTNSSLGGEPLADMLVANEVSFFNGSYTGLLDESSWWDDPVSSISTLNLSGERLSLSPIGTITVTVDGAACHDRAGCGGVP